MAMPTRQMVAGMFLGAAAALGVMTVGPGTDIRAMAAEMFPSFDPSHLVKFKDRLFTVDYDDSVSTEPTNVTHIRKIEYGRMTTVDVTTTPSGTYSSDALFSPHIRYPGVFVTALTGKAHPIRSVAFWSEKSGWVEAPLVNAHSVMVLGTH